MIDISRPDPFELASWRANLLPSREPVKLAWLLCSVLNLVYGWPFLEILDGQASDESWPKA